MKTTRLAFVMTALTVFAACGNSGPSASEQAGQTPAVSQALETNLGWTLDAEASRIGFTSIKAGEIIENHAFSGLSGTVNADGVASVTIPLSTVETGIEIRNERMQEMFFETAAHPSASVDVAIDPEAYKTLGIGERQEADIEGTLSLHGVQAPISASVTVTRIGPARVEVASAQPVIVYVKDFGLSTGLEALRNIANLPAITPASPVTFSFIFETKQS